MEDFISYYQSSLCIRGLVLLHNGILKNLAIGTLFIVLIVLYIFIFINGTIWWYFTLIPIIIAAILLGRYLCACTVKKHYPRAYISKHKWSNEILNSIINDNLASYISKNNYGEKLDEIQRILNNKAQKEKLPFMVYSTVFGVLFLPIWISYMAKVFEIFKNDFNSLSLVFLISIIVTASVAFLIPLVYEFQDVFLSRYQVLNNLISLIDEYKLKQSSTHEISKV